METKVYIENKTLFGVPDPDQYIVDKLVEGGIPAFLDGRHIRVEKGLLAYGGEHRLYIYVPDDANTKQSA